MTFEELEREYASLRQQADAKVMQDRKQLEQSIADSDSVVRLTSDLDTLFELGREAKEVAGDSRLSFVG